MEDMGIFYEHCLEVLYPPGSCGTFCNEHTFECYLAEIEEACCDEDGANCVQGVRHTCLRSLTFKFYFLEACSTLLTLLVVRAQALVPRTCPIGCALVFPDFTVRAKPLLLISNIVLLVLGEEIVQTTHNIICTVLFDAALHDCLTFAGDLSHPHAANDVAGRRRSIQRLRNKLHRRRLGVLSLPHHMPSDNYMWQFVCT